MITSNQNNEYRIQFLISKWHLSFATIALINLLDFSLSSDGILMSDFISSILFGICMYFAEIKINIFKIK